MRNCRRPARAVRALPALLASALLGIGIGVGACGSSASTSISSRSGYLKEDGDKDGDDGAYPAHPGQDDQSFLATYGGRARPATARAIASVVERYYAASLAGDGASACALLNAGLATALAAQRGRAAQGDRACAAALSPLLAQQHPHLLAEDPATMVVTGVYAKGNLGLAVLGFRSAPESDIVVAREGRAWRIDALFDNQMT
jgi:hypothetical protein